MLEKVILIGGGAHAFSMIDLLGQIKSKYTILGYTDTKKTSLSLRYLGDDKKIIADKKCGPKNVKLVMGVGTHIQLRKKVFNFFKHRGYKFLTHIHRSAVISPTARCGEGSVIFPGVILGPDVKIGDNVCVHSKAVVEHRTAIGNHSYISPSVSIAGDNYIGEGCFFGINASMIESISLKSGTVVGAGAVVLRSFNKKDVTLVGIPARILKRRKNVRV